MEKKVKMKYTVAIEMLLLSILFTVLTMTVDVRPVGPDYTEVGLSHINSDVHAAVGTNITMYNISQILGYAGLALVAVFALIGFIQLVKRRSLKKVDTTILVMGGLYIITLALYVIFDKAALNYRPVFMPGETELEASFPSSHSMMALVVYGSVAKVISEFVSNEKISKLLKLILILLAVTTVVCRFLSGVHWLTDIIAGIIIGLTLLVIFDAVLASVNSSKKKDLIIELE